MRHVRAEGKAGAVTRQRRADHQAYRPRSGQPLPGPRGLRRRDPETDHRRAPNAAARQHPPQDHAGLRNRARQPADVPVGLAAAPPFKKIRLRPDADPTGQTLTDG